jgi:hypothetical protein
VLILICRGEQSQQYLTLLVLACQADQTWQVDAITAVRTACRGRCGSVLPTRFEWLFAMQPASPVGNRADRATADAQVHRDLALRQFALGEQTIDFVDKRDGQHES